MISTFDSNLKLSIYGESHGPEIGMKLEGIPAGVKVDMEELQAFLDRRAPGRDRFSTARKEADRPEFLSGIERGVTTGDAIEAVIRNAGHHSTDYEALKDTPRPGHADYTARMKYGEEVDLRGGGHFSGRLTAPLCIAGGIVKQILAGEGISIDAKIVEIGGNSEDPFSEIDRAREDKDSVGGIVECKVAGLIPGVGTHMFLGLENQISRVVFAIPAVKGIEFGLGFGSAKVRGSENNDSFVYEDGKIVTETNNCGGILGGMSTGMPVEFRVAFKPTPSIALPQRTVSYSRKENVEIEIKGRHDPCIVPRALPCVEAAAAIAIYDLMKQE